MASGTGPVPEPEGLSARRADPLRGPSTGPPGWFETAGPVMLAVAVFAVMVRWAERVLRLPEQAYGSAVLSGEVMRELVLSTGGLVGLLPLLALAALRYRELGEGWSRLEHGRGARALVIFLVAWATWAAVTFDHNLFYDRSYDLDRLLLLILTVLVVWRPVFVIPHAFLFIALEHQFDHPFGRQIFARVILEDLLLLFIAALLANAILRRRELRSFIFVACALLASYYWFPGIVKLLRGWVGYGQLYLGGFASYANGWLAAWPADRIETLLRVGALLDWPARVMTLLTELGALVFFVHRLVPRLLLGAWAILHAGIWLFSGVSFLVWIAVDIAFLVIFFTKPGRGPDVFSRRFAIGGAALILASPLWVGPPPVGWFDTRLVYTYRYRAVDIEGNVGAFPADATPLGEAWCARDFPFLAEAKTLLVRYGKTNDRELARSIAALDSRPESVFALERERGRSYFDEARAGELDRYLRTTAQHWNRRGSFRHRLSWAAPPRTCLSPRTPPEKVLSSGLAIRTIHVDQLTFFFDGEQFREIRRMPVRTVDVPPAG